MNQILFINKLILNKLIFPGSIVIFIKNGINNPCSLF
jgi:hypothetical protein